MLGFTSIISVPSLSMRCIYLPLLVLLLSSLLTACTAENDVTEEKQNINGIPSTEWILQNLSEGNINPRLSHGLKPSGQYVYALDSQWQSKKEDDAFLITQARFVYVMAVGYAVFDDPQYETAMLSAADYLIENFAIPGTLGEFAWRITTEEGATNNLKSNKMGWKQAYAHSQVIFAMAHVYMLTDDETYLNTAYSIWTELNVLEQINAKSPGYLVGLNTSMHTFEALLALFKASDSMLVKNELEQLGSFINNHFFDVQSGLFAEWLNDDKSPQLQNESRLGHNIEMAFLFSRAVDAGLSEKLLFTANSVVGAVAKIAQRSPEFLIPHTVGLNGDVGDDSHPWWGQTELIRGLAHFVIERKHTEYSDLLNQVVSSTQQNYVKPSGAWSTSPNQEDDDNGHNWKVGYHTSMMLTELLRLQQFRFRTGHELLL